MFHASENIHVSHTDYLLACRAVTRSEPAFALWASARQPSLASPQAGNMACRAVAREASEGGVPNVPRFGEYTRKSHRLSPGLSSRHSERARLRPLGFGAAAFARFAASWEYGLPSRSSRSERRWRSKCSTLRRIYT